MNLSKYKTARKRKLKEIFKTKRNIDILEKKDKNIK
jgi:hypothetical protein